MDTLIIGAGIAGLLAATELQKAGHNVIVLEKGRGVGGRMATRKLTKEGAVADHGAQFFTVRDAQFQQWVEQWLAADVAAEWCLGFAGNDGHPRYKGQFGMTSIPKLLANVLDVYTRSKVTDIQQEEGRWRLETESGMLYRADNLIMTPPVPQSLALLNSSGIDLPTESKQALEAIAYHPCFAAMVHLNESSQIPHPGGVQARGEVIDWIGDNQQKGISAETTVTIHASPQFTTEHLDSNRTEVGDILIQAAETDRYFAASNVIETQVHRWLYAQPITHYPDRCLRVELNGLPLIFAGDAFKHARVEGAALSGLAAAENLIVKKAQRD